MARINEFLEGGCLCGAIRYRIEGIPDHVGHCHCEPCRKASGAAFATFAWMPDGKIEWSGTEPVKYRSSNVATRWFCPDCGAMLAFKYDADDGIDIAATSLDDPSAVTPTMHTWYASRVAWVNMDDDGLVKYDRNSPGSIVQV